MDRSEQTKKNQAINLYTWGLELPLTAATSGMPIKWAGC